MSGPAPKGRTGTARAKHPRGTGPRDEHRPPPSARETVRMLVIWAAILADMCAGWLLAQLLFGLTGRPPEPAAFLIAVVIAFFLAVGIGMLVARITGRTPRDPIETQRDVLAALDRMSRGDFSVRVPAPRDKPLAEIVGSVNQLAEQLGDLEQQRQDFISSVSHEIQSPLTSISGFAALVREGGLDERTRDHYLDVIGSEAKRVSALGDNLLRLTMLEDVALDRRRFRVDEQVRGVVLAFEPQWAAKGLDVEFDGDPVTVDADDAMLRQVWTNLIHNAIKYNHDGGHLRVTLTSDADGLHCAVADDGIGISAADLPHVFERFFRADRSRTGAGNGLGLSLARRIVELHGGRLSVTSDLGVGSTFTVWLPLTLR